MEPIAEKIDRLFVAIFEDILAIEENTLRNGFFTDISVKEMHTVEAIGLHGHITAGEAARKLGITLGTLTVAIDKLMRKGYVERLRCNGDRRIVFLSLTKRGRLLYRIHRQFHSNIVCEALEQFEDEKKDVLLEALTKLHDYLYEKYTAKNTESEEDE